jgi:hypothetical protein
MRHDAAVRPFNRVHEGFKEAQMLYQLRVWWGMRKLRRMPPDERRRMEYLMRHLAGNLERMIGP